MTRYLISFPSGAMVLPEGDLQQCRTRRTELPTHEAALVRGAEFAAACRWAQEVRAFQHDPAS